MLPTWLRMLFSRVPFGVMGTCRVWVMLFLICHVELELPLFSPGRARFANVKVNLVSWLLPQGAAGLPPEGCSHQGEFPPAAFYPSASTSGLPGWCSAGLSPAPEIRFSSYIAFWTLPWGSQLSPREWRRRCTLLLEESSPSPSSPPKGGGLMLWNRVACIVFATR